ncbi:MAG: hypothetical protein RIQ53_2347 [Pseudomonadota bacterium]|jgi:signal transduction histidine kinase/ActR/RegA family two-component response regulator
MPPSASSPSAAPDPTPTAPPAATGTATARPTPDRVATPWRDRGFRRVLAIALGAGAVVAAALWGLRMQTLDQEWRLLRAMVAAQAGQADASLTTVVSLLRSTAGELRRGTLKPGSDDARRLLQARLGAQPALRGFWLLDAQGRVLTHAVRDGVQLPERPPAAWLQGPERLDDEGRPLVAIATPATTPGDAPPLLGLRLPWRPEAVGPREDAGPAGGTLLVVADARLLDGAFTRSRPDSDVTLGIYREDAALLSDGQGSGRRSGDEGGDHTLLSTDQVQLLQRLCDAGGPGAQTAELQRHGGPSRLLVAQRLEQHPLLVVVSRERSQVLEAWRRLATGIGLFALLALGASVWMAWRQAGEAIRRRASEAALAAEQARQQRAGKLEALGTLAGGVAHDFNNILAVVIGHAELARDAAPAGSAQARWLDQILQAGARGRAIVERILAFSRGGAGAPARRFALQTVAAQVLPLQRTTWPASVQVHTVLQAPQAELLGDPAWTAEALTNLCQNAVQAMPGGGTLTVALHLRPVERALTIGDRQLAPGPHVELSVSDTGCGMSEAVQARIFEPFFTTKGPRQGTGLGLAVVHGWVEAMGGAIRVDSAPGRGTRFVLLLPCRLADGAAATDLDAPAPAAAAPAPSSPPATGTTGTTVATDATGTTDATRASAAPYAPATVAGTPPPGGQRRTDDDEDSPRLRAAAGLPQGEGQCILVVDDEPALVEMTEELLAGLGYEAYGLSDPVEALTRLRADLQRFDLVLTDELMPELCGTALAAEVRALRPDLPVLMASGWGGAQLNERACGAGVCRVLAKPLDLATLAQAVHAALQPQGDAAGTAPSPRTGS